MAPRDARLEGRADYVHAHGARVVPIEVKAGASGTLRSLHRFVFERDLPVGVRVNAAAPVFEAVDLRMTTGERVAYRLLSVPLYLTGALPRLLDEVAATE